MTVHCPHCLTGYELPESLLGQGGARVRCPGCQEIFVVHREGGPAPGHPPARGVTPEATSGAGSGSGGGAVAAPGKAAAARHDSSAAAPVQDPDAAAGAVLGVLADFLGEALTRSRARGTVFADHGPAILAVWDEYRRRAGADAPAAAFRAALRDRCGVDLTSVNGG
jgi:predicted Zn finger-like uncharacterized protein